jgi:hypothetical protein
VSNKDLVSRRHKRFPRQTAKKAMDEPHRQARRAIRASFTACSDQDLANRSHREWRKWRQWKKRSKHGRPVPSTAPDFLLMALSRHEQQRRKRATP